MKLPTDTPQIIEYRCNICGSNNWLEKQLFHRELAICHKCGANARFRGIISIVGQILGEELHTPLSNWKVRKHISGIGMSDWPGYANLLQKKLNYQNTFYDRKPQLDIMNLSSNYVGKYDFIICSDVFEHILQPLQRGFDNLLQLLKPGGHLVFSVPYTRADQTVEHYPGLRDYKMFDFQGGKIIVNRDEAGQLQVYDKPVFHGGEGTTLELRVFCETDVLSRLGQAGFKNIHIYDQPQLSIGYYWPELKSADPNAPLLYAYLISALRPSTIAT
jgi:SAM-dependent methyltransferase